MRFISDLVNNGCRTSVELKPFHPFSNAAVIYSNVYTTCDINNQTLPSVTRVYLALITLILAVRVQSKLLAFLYSSGLIDFNSYPFSSHRRIKAISIYTSIYLNPVLLFIFCSFANCSSLSWYYNVINVIRNNNQTSMMIHHR